MEYPIPFQKNEENNIAHLYIEDEVIKDKEGYPIEDNTVVEFIYDNNKEIDKNKRWIPLKTRYDKTDQVMKYKKKYGNNSQIANKIFNSMIDQINIEDIKILSKFNTNKIKKYIDEQNVKKNKIINSQDNSKEINTYYQKRTEIGIAMREFHNWIKTNLINIYCSNKRVLDTGIGRGGDIYKYYHSGVKYVVGIDIDNNGINSKFDGCIVKYENIKKKYQDIQNMVFLVGNSGIKYDYENQKNIFADINNTNKNNLIEYFGKNEKDKNYKLFDVINC